MCKSKFCTTFQREGRLPCCQYLKENTKDFALLVVFRFITFVVMILTKSFNLGLLFLHGFQMSLQVNINLLIAEQEEFLVRIPQFLIPILIPNCQSLLNNE